MTMTLQDRILTNSTPTAAGCWEWTRATFEGYGSLTVEGRGMGAHRASYTAFVGPIPNGLTVDHTCFNPSCVNPDHLRLLTHQENARNKDPHKTPPWVVAARMPRYRKPKRQPLPPNAPVIDFEEDVA